ncbi:MAG: hypothetical protein EPN22_10405 [Nitrospirae bacterium]|nr:MAG: hypothetical protein EPN22_10405 [Nitrospirota bacterium]
MIAGLKQHISKYPRLKKALKSAKTTILGAALGIIKSGSLRSGLTVFVYHDVSPSPAESSRRYSLNVPPSVFEFQLEFIKKRFNVIGPDELLSGKVPPKAALITFDDGLKGFFTYAVPLLEKHELPVIIFMNMAPVKGEVFWSGLITYLCEKRDDFVPYLKERAGNGFNEKAPFLSCSREIVHSYLNASGRSFDEEVSAFIGPFAAEDDLKAASGIKNIYFGNHLYNHDNALLLSDSELIESFRKNEEALAAYSNTRPLFAFPFGQPGACFNEREMDILFANGAKKIFSSFPVVNVNPSARFLHRIALYETDRSCPKIWHRIFRQRNQAY